MPEIAREVAATRLRAADTALAFIRRFVQP